jgi:outer membrane lipoprotein carrier protein
MPAGNRTLSAQRRQNSYNRADGPASFPWFQLRILRIHCRLALRGLFLAAVAIVCVRISSSVAAEVPVDVNAVAAAVDAHYDHLRSLEAEFTEMYRGSGLDRTESGTLWLKKPGKMRWEYRSPKVKLFVSDGRDAWFYLPDDRQARKTAARKLEDIRSPLAFLLGKTKLEKELQGLSQAPDVPPLTPGDVVLRGVPVGFADRISEIVLEVTPDHKIVRLIIQEVDGSATEYRFQDQKENVAIASRQFQFQPPPGTETVDGLGP